MYKIIFLILLVGFARAGEQYINPSGSMLPTLLPDQKLEINYLKSPSIACVKCDHPVQRGELWAYVTPDKLTDVFVKRVVGLPGDKVKIKEGALSLNGKVLTQKSSRDKKLLEGIKDEFLPQGKEKCTLHQEVLEKKSYQIILCHKKEATDFEGVVPEGHVFILGDNRDNSLDSRLVGPIPLSHLKGQVKPGH